MKALAIIFEGFEELEAVAPFALLRRAKIELTIAGEKNTTAGSHGIEISGINDYKKINYKEYDTVIFSGGLGQYKHMMADSYVHEIIKYFIESNKLICTICAAPTVLGSLGYLKGKNYTCFTSMNQDFGGIYHDTGVVVDGNLITARSAAYAIDFGYAIIEKMAGKEHLAAVQKSIYYEK